MLKGSILVIEMSNKEGSCYILMKFEKTFNDLFWKIILLFIIIHYIIYTFNSTATFYELWMVNYFTYTCDNFFQVSIFWKSLALCQ